ncbi:hypothetical protein TNIN_113581 [Trichonephila inaurata madagascariensis]|uniref:Uncharacterized protein n=1 Tax=Trichonephila inaurata madagascariensis TaxID=2747483 RepID=A0A8X6XT24_9ARAC|nr:hypothetical protein TNIN_113581 [Trichonephila inaurata madagascariensis]
MHPLLENINLFDINSLTEENVKDILTEARVLPEKASTPMCPICKSKTSANRDSSRKLGWMWICKKKYQSKWSGKSLEAKVQMFLENISWIFPGYGKEGLQLRKIEVPTVESEGISDMMPTTFNKKILNALSDDDVEVPFVDYEDGYPNWEEFKRKASNKGQNQ